MTMMNDFPFDKLPQFGAFPLPIYQGAVNEVIRAHRVPSKLAHYCALTAAGTLAQMCADVKKPAGGIVPTSVYVMLDGKSGERKSKVDQEFFSEFRRPSAAQRNRYLDELDAHKVREKIWKCKNKVLMGALAKACANVMNTEAIEESLFKNAAEKPKEPRELKLIYNDVTIEALKNKLDQSPNATLLSSDGKKILKDFLLQNDADLNQMWSDEEIDVERKTVRSYRLKGVRVSFSVMLQREALSRIMLDKGKQGQESGFFARVIFSDVGSTQGDRLIDIIENPIPNLDAFNARVATVMTEYFEAIVAGNYSRRLLTMSAEASRVWIAYFNYVESNNKAGGRYEKAGDHASKLADNVARVAAGLHVLEGFEGEIGMDCLLCAIALCNEASKDYMKHLAPKDQDEIEADALKDWLIEKFVSKPARWVETNKVLQCAPSRMRSAKKIHRYLEILERDKFLTVWPTGSGGRKCAVIEFCMEGRAAAEPAMSTRRDPLEFPNFRSAHLASG